MDYKRGQDTYDDGWRAESTAPFDPDQSVNDNDPNPNASWGSTGDVAFHATTWDTRLEADGSLTTRIKGGPANQARGV